jgi:hypothetical protein
VIYSGDEVYGDDVTSPEGIEDVEASTDEECMDCGAAPCQACTPWCPARFA